jgi:hypothetical protein
MTRVRRLGVLMLLSLASALSGQSAPGRRDSLPAPLTTTDRMELINSVLEARPTVMAGRMVVDACTLAKALEMTADVHVALSEKHQSLLHGRPAAKCVDYAGPDERGAVKLMFDKARPENGERIVIGSVHGPHSALVVVPIYVLSSMGRNHYEEWVMVHASPGRWQVHTVRVFGFIWF